MNVRQLIAATITSIHEEGFANATISRISRTAGMSGGIVAHYFDDKAGLLAATGDGGRDQLTPPQIFHSDLGHPRWCLRLTPLRGRGRGPCAAACRTRGILF